MNDEDPFSRSPQFDFGPYSCPRDQDDAGGPWPVTAWSRLPEAGKLVRMPDGATWFASLFGSPEASYAETQARFTVEGTRLHSHANGKSFEIGTFTTPTLNELRASVAERRSGRIHVRHEAIGDVLKLHGQSEQQGATFQVASQLNCLEFAHPNMTPEDGITGYAHDPTQGPACALAAAPATLFRNYFAPLGGRIGQTREHQIDNLDVLTAALGAPGEYFTVRNGYTFSEAPRLRALAATLAHHDREALLGAVKIGVQRRVEVTFTDRFVSPSQPQWVSQAFCSAISCGYTDLALDLWEPLATLVLDAAYEATLLAAASDLDQGDGSGIVWLTFLGGGAFGNRPEWIARAIGRALVRCQDLPLDVRVGHYRRIDSSMQRDIDATTGC